MKMMMFLMIVFCHTASPVTHSLTFLSTGLFGEHTWPEFVVVVLLDDVVVISCDSDTRRPDPKQDWMKTVTGDERQHMDTFTDECKTSSSNFKSSFTTLMQLFNQTGGVHTVQRMHGCKWDDDTDEDEGFDRYGYDGEDLMRFSLKTKTWIPAKPQAVVTKHMWEDDGNIRTFLTVDCPHRLKMYLSYSRTSLLRTVRPSVSLLQTSPSSPVSCHATGFYPDRATMFWRKDGEELHEDVDHGEILPNQDGTFQMTVDLNISSVKPEDWTRYDCVFQVSGAENDTVIKLDKAVIRTNWGSLDRLEAAVRREFPSVSSLKRNSVPFVLISMAFIVFVSGLYYVIKVLLQKLCGGCLCKKK